MNLARLLLVTLAAARATRFVTTDWLGEWTLVRPLKRWAILGDHREGRDPVEGSNHEVDLHEGGWRSKLVSGLDCPFCVGYWVGALLLVGEVVTRRVPVLRGAWTLLLGSLALNYAVGHLSSRADG